MKISSFILFIALLHFQIHALGMPQDFDWNNRPIAIHLYADELKGSVPSHFYSAGKLVTVIRLQDRLKIGTWLNEEMKGQNFALHIKKCEVTVAINGKPLEIIPVQASDGWYFFVPSSSLQVGRNLLELQSIDNTTPQPDLVEMFALKFSNEEVHFSRVFGDIGTRTQPPPDSSQPLFDVLHYSIHHIITMTSSQITANTLMVARSLDSSNTLQTIALDFDNNGGGFSVNSVDQGPGTSTAGFTVSGSSSRLFIFMPNPLPLNSVFTVRVFYNGIPNPAINLFSNIYAYYRTTHSSTAIVSSFSEPYGARRWWPCKDLPDDKATVDTHWTCPTTYYTVSNGTLVSIDTNGDDTYTFNYDESYPLATYLVSMACTNYTTLFGVYTSLDSLSYMSVRNYVYPENLGIEGNGMVGTIYFLQMLAQYFGEYPFLSEKYVTASHNYSSSMEHQTCTSLGKTLLSPDGHTRANVHEMAHQWFGDKITCQTFDHLWLNEGFATYSEALWQEYQYGTNSYHSYVNAWTTSDSYPLVSNQADNFAGSIVYRKGAWVLHMLRHIVGDTTFFQAIRNYVDDTTLVYGTAVSSDLQRNFETTMGNGTSMAWFFDEWLYQTKRPTYTWSWSNHTEGANTILDLRITQTQSGTSYIMPLDFQVFYAGGGNTTVIVWNTQKSQQDFHLDLGPGITVNSVLIDPDNWVLKNAVQVDIPDWMNYANTMNTIPFILQKESIVSGNIPPDYKND